jgi:hypothetical protein
MRTWNTNGSARADTRISAMERWAAMRGHFKLANMLAGLRVWFR